MKKYKFGVCIWCLPYTGEKACDLINSLGFNGLELDMGSFDNGFELSKKEIQQEYINASSKYKIEYPSVAINAFCKYGMSDPQNRHIILESLKIAAETAAKMNIPLIQLPSFVNGNIIDENGFLSTLECLNKACEYAKKYNLIVGTENALSANDNKRLLKELNKDNLKIYFDTQNPYRMRGLDSAQIANDLLTHICEVHVKDSLSGINGCLALGEGDTNFLKTINVLLNSDFNGWILLENSYKNDKDFKLMQKDFNILKSLI